MSLTCLAKVVPHDFVYNLNVTQYNFPVIRRENDILAFEVQ